MFNPDFENLNQGDNGDPLVDEEKAKELKMQNKLIEEGKKYNNDFVFVEPKIKLKKNELPEKINLKIFDGENIPNYISVLEAQLQELNKFISSSFIKDSFADNHTARRAWKKKYFEHLSPESQECYRNNRFGITNASHSVSLLDFLRNEKLIKDDDEASINPEVLKKLEEAAIKIPEVIYNRDSAYGRLSEEEKIKTMEDLAPVIETFINILGEKAENKK